MKSKSAVLASLGVLAIFGIPALFIVKALLDAFVLIKLWGWFITPTFGLKPFGYMMTAGILYSIRYAVYQTDTVKEEHKKKFPEVLINAFIAPFISLGFGYLISLFL